MNIVSADGDLSEIADCDLSLLVAKGFTTAWDIPRRHRTTVFTTKHLYFSGPKKKFRVRYDRIVDFEPFDDGFGLMRDAQTAKPQSFRAEDGWFAFNLATNLAQM